MKEDPILAELHKYREEWAAQFNYDIHAMVAELRRQQEEEGRVIVNFSDPKKTVALTKDTMADDNTVVDSEHKIMSTEIGSFITRTPGTVGGRPRIDGTRVTVRSVAVCYKQGLMPEEIVQQYEHLTIAQIYAALTYYHANRDEIEADIKAENEFYEEALKAQQQLRKNA